MNESTVSANASTVVQTENKAKVVATFFAWWKSNLSKETSYSYWRDVHAIWASRTPGFYQYRQFHLENIDSTLLPDLVGIETTIPKEDQPDGIAHIAYSSTFIANILRKPFALKQADEDEQYFVARNTYQRAMLPFSRTYIDKITDPEVSGTLNYPRYVLAFKKQVGISEADFQTYLTQNFCEPWSQKKTVQRLRLDLLNAPTGTDTSPNGVAHVWEERQQYQAWIDLGLKEGTQLLNFFDASKDLNQYIAAIHVYPVRAVYTIVYNGKPTLVGLRGYAAAKIIQEMGATFQASKSVLQFTYGAAINGGRFLSQSFYVGFIALLVIVGILCYFL